MFTNVQIFLRLAFTVFIFSAQAQTLHAQVKSYIQIKAFDPHLNPVENVEVSINNGQFIALDDAGVAFTEIDSRKLPPKSIDIRDPKLKAASWNYSKGILEIIIRKKEYELVAIYLKTSDNTPLANIEVTFAGKEKTAATTNESGIFEIPVLIGRKPGAGQFNIDGYRIARLDFSGKNNTIIAEPLAPVASQIAAPPAETEKKDYVIDEQYFDNFDLANLDSIQSLTVFYAVFKNYEIGQLSEDLKQKIDAKFNELVGQMEDSVKYRESETFISKISDSSFVKDDIKHLLDQALLENEVLDHLREEFDEKVQLINDKLKKGEELDDATRKQLLRDINLLEKILSENEDKFYRNQTYYHVILSSFKNQLFNIQELKEQLVISEQQRQEEREQFQKQILKVFLVTIGFGLFIILLLYFSRKLKKQQLALISANDEVKKVNENLESLVTERTQLLINANEEMDTFLYRASHNLRRPICSIIGLSAVAEYSQVSDSPDLFQKVSQTAHEMDNVLGKLLIVNEINHPENYSMINLTSMLENLKVEFQTTIQQHNIDFKMAIPQDLDFYSYPRLVEVMLKNLLENALYFSTLKMHVTPEIRIEATKKNNNLTVSIYDNGIGIDEAVQEDVWNMFFIGTDRSKGNGLGLYIVRKSVEALKGRIFFESKKNEFTRFVVNIPVQKKGA